MTQNEARRRVELILNGFGEHTAWPDLSSKPVYVSRHKVGEPDSSGSPPRKMNAVFFEYSKELPHDYNERIELLLEALGNEDGVRRIISAYGAAQKWIRLWIPVRSSEWSEEGHLSEKTLGRLCNLGLDLEFWYT